MAKVQLGRFGSEPADSDRRQLTSPFESRFHFLSDGDHLNAHYKLHISDILDFHFRNYES
jgi:hypothetical protein